jgi:hypothetical protein
MCIFCAAIPATAAVGVNLHANQLRKESLRLPIPQITAILIGLLVICSAIYHTFSWRN